jgi:hypothetical protein
MTMTKPVPRNATIPMTFAHAFTLPGFDEVLPPGDYDIAPDAGALFDPRNPLACAGRAELRLHARQAHPGLARSLSVSLTALSRAGLRDRERGRDLVDVFLESMLSDPMIWLVMGADGVSEDEVRTRYARLRSARQVTAGDVPALNRTVGLALNTHAEDHA